VDPEMQSNLLALCAVDHVNWHVIAREAQHPSGLERLLRGDLAEKSKEARATQKLLAAADLDAARRRAAEEIRRAQEIGAKLVTVLDDDYPANLRVIYNLPPFLFYRGRLEREDARSIAVVGTREASDEGIDSARRMAGRLAQNGVTILSGLARGIDTVAHEETRAGRPNDRGAGHRHPRLLPKGERRSGGAHRGVRGACLSVLAYATADDLQFSSPECSHLWDEPRDGRDRGEQDLGSQDAGPPRPRARQAGLPRQPPRHVSAVGAEIRCRARRDRDPNGRGRACAPTLTRGDRAALRRAQAARTRARLRGHEPSPGACRIRQLWQVPI